MMTTPLQLPVHYFGSAVTILSTTQPDGTTNLTPISSTWSLADRYVLGLATMNQGARNLERTGEVVVNLPDASLVPAIEAMALTTGAADVPAIKHGVYRRERDKWGLSGLTPEAGSLIAPDRVLECPVQIECVLESSLPLTEEMRAYHVRILQVHAHEGIVTPSGRVDTSRWTPVYYTFRHYFAQGREVGINVRADQ